MNLSATPDSLFRFSRIFSWGLAPRCLGLPVLTALILCSHPLTNTPAALGVALVARFTPRQRPSSCFNRLGVHIALFEACSVFILIRGCVLADPAALDLLHRRLRAEPLPVRHAPTASGWSNSCRAGYLPPTGSTRPFHGALKPQAKSFYPFGISPTRVHIFDSTSRANKAPGYSQATAVIELTL